MISGYLISAIIFSDIAGSRFSVLGFYERRIRRIFTALFGMLIGFTAVACFFLLPAELVDYGKSLLAAVTSTSNFYFWQHSGYFDMRIDPAAYLVARGGRTVLYSISHLPGDHSPLLSATAADRRGGAVFCLAHYQHRNGAF